MEIYALSTLREVGDNQSLPEILCSVEQVQDGVVIDADGNPQPNMINTYSTAYPYAYTHYADIDGKALVRIHCPDDAWEILHEHEDYVASSMEELLVLHPEIAKHLLFIVYRRQDELESVDVQVNAHEYDPAMGPVVEVRKKFSREGIFKAPALRPQVQILSDIDAGLIDGKVRVKPFALGWIKANPTCTQEEAIAAVDDQYDEYDAALSKALLREYVQGAHKQRLIANAAWEDFRDFIVATPEEQLLAI